MIDKVRKDECVLCKACSQICPVKCIDFTDAYLSFDYPKINKEKCINCNLCELVCPVFCEFESDSLKKCYAVRSKNIDVLKISSSGGVFYSLASFVLENNGVVIGALFDKDFNVKHGMVSNLMDLNKLCGSKYVQSDINDIFIKVKQQLEENKTVLFVGSSCQTAALTTFLGGKPQKLFLVDFICHSVVSEKVFNEYKIYLEKKHNGKIVDFKFRDKADGWIKSGLRVEFSNGKVYSAPLYKDVYMQGYFKNLNTKEVCKTCKYKNFKSKSDLTLGDFWGVELLKPDFYDYLGNSILVLNTHKGELLFKEVSDQFEIEDISLQNILKYNKGLVESFQFNEKRKDYFKNAEKVGYIKPLEKYTKTNIVKRVLIKLKELIKIG